MNDTPTGRTVKLLGAGARTLGRSLLRKIPGGDRAQKRVDYWTAVGQDWAQTLGEMRGAAMKLGQLASQYADVLPPQLAEQLRKLQNAAEPLPFAKIQAVLAQRWSDAQRALIAEIEPVALASASIGQVHGAQLVDGRRVVVKVRYPGVEQAVDADLTQLRRLIGMSKLLPIDGPAMDRLMGEVRARFRDETDYAAELGYLEHLRTHAAMTGIVYPEPLPALCGPGVLVLSEERGAPITVARHWPQALRDRLGTTLIRWLVHQIFVAKAVHADPHPGNFAFRDSGDGSGAAVIYDYGCVKRIPDAVLDDVHALMEAVARRDWNAAHRAQDRLGGIADGAKYEHVAALYADLDRLLVEPLANLEGFDFADPAFIDLLRGSFRDHIGMTFRFKPVTDLVFVVRALSGMYWLLRTLGARVNINAVLAEFGLRLRR